MILHYKRKMRLYANIIIIIFVLNLFTFTMFPVSKGYAARNTFSDAEIGSTQDGEGYSHADDGMVRFLGPQNAHNLLVTEINWGDHAEPAKIIAEADILPVCDPGDSWTPSLRLYWNESEWISIGVTNDGRTFLPVPGRRSGNAQLGKWHQVRLILQNGKIEIWGGIKGAELTLIHVDDNPPQGLPSHIIIGKGFGNGTSTYPAPFTANDFSNLGPIGLSYMDNVSLQVDDETIISDNFDTGIDLSRWTPYLSSSIEPVVTVEIPYHSEDELSEMSEGVFYVDGKFIILNDINNFRFRDGIKYMQAKLIEGQWVIKEVESMEHIYVSPDGDDNNDGTKESPFATINKAALIAVPGSTVHVLPGTYTERVVIKKSGTADARIRFVSEEKWGAKINVTCQEDIDALFFNGNYLDIEGFEITGDCLFGINGNMHGRGSSVRIIGNHIHSLAHNSPHGGAGIVAYDDVEVIGNVVHNIGPDDEESTLIHGIYTVGKNIKVANNITYNNAGWGIHTWHSPSDTTISNNLIFGNRKGGIEIGASDSASGFGADNFIVTNNIIVFNNNEGVIELGKTGPNNRYENNLVYGNVGKAFSLQGEKNDKNTLVVDPQFVDFKLDGTGDYHLKAISPAIGNGTKLGAPPIDYDGVARQEDKPMDIGPFHYTGEQIVRIEVPYDTVKGVTDSSDGVFYLNGRFMIPESVTEFTFKDGYNVMQANIISEEWIFKEVEQIKHLYVSPRGSDYNPGTKEKPFATLNKAADVAIPGTTVHVLPGVYPDPVKIIQGGEDGAWIRFVSEEKWGAKIKVANKGSVPLTIEEDYVEFEGFEMTANNALYGVIITGSNVKVKGNHIYGIAPKGGPWGSAIVTYDSIYGKPHKIHNVDIVGNLIHDIGPKDGTGGNIHGIYIAGDNMKVINNVSHNNGGFGIRTWNAARNSTISNNLVFGNGEGGIQVGAGDTPDNVVADNFIVTNNIVVYNNGDGILELGNTGANNRYENNLVYGNTGEAFRLHDGKIDKNTLTTDPEFIDFKMDGSGDYHLKPTSPCIGAGTKFGAPRIDFNGNVRPSDKAIDIGPFQFTLEDPIDPKDPVEPEDPEIPEEVRKVIDLIEKLPELSELTLSDKDNVQKARIAYDALSDENKVLVINLKVLEAAERRIEELEKEDPKKEDPKKEDPKKEDPKKKDPKKEGLKKKEPKKATSKELPKTGRGDVKLVFVGLMLLAMGILFMFTQKSHSRHNS